MGGHPSPLQMAGFQHAGWLQTPRLNYDRQARPSLGNSRDDPWSNIKLHFNEGIGSKLMQEVIVTWLRKALVNYKPVIGLQHTISEDNTKLLDINCPMAAFLLSHMSSSSLIVTPKLVLVQSLEEASNWNVQLTQLWQNNPPQAASKLRLRDSSSARTKKVAEVQATKEQLAAAKKRGGHEPTKPSEDKPETLRATLDIPIPVESDLDTWLGGLMAKISASSGVPLSPQLQQEGLEWDSWKAVQDFEGNWAGKVIIQCSKADDLYKLQAAVHSKGIVVEGHTTTISLASDYVDLFSFYGSDH